MAEMLPETKIERLIERMKPLAKWYAENRPSVKVIRLSSDDLKLLSDNPGAAMGKGVYIDSGVVTWSGFELRST